MLPKYLIILVILFINFTVFAQGKIYFVLGSDTSIWEGLDTKNYKHHYLKDLYTDPSRNAYRVMDPTYRNLMKDSYGTPMKLTWWMMAGNTFRYADNTNVPAANSIIFHLMKKYHGEQVKLFGDELSLHYHNFTWTDYDNDGRYWWNQARSFTDYIEDFKFTLAQLLLDENIFPVSFRSGWHFMDNYWQNYLEYVLPFSLHNDYPHKHTDTEEPLDNIYDWSKATSEFIPFHPSAQNYQVPGNLNGYNVRSVYTKSFSQSLSNSIFQKAANGTDQLVCIWSHLPEADFLEQLIRVDSIIHFSASSYSNVEFEYCTGIEGYQKYLSATDSIAPTITIIPEEIGEEIYFSITTDEEIFQMKPFVALKSIHEQYFVLECEEISKNNWKTIKPAIKSTIAKVGVAATDPSGNLSTKLINYLPDDIFIDNNDERYSEIYGNWSTLTNSAWDSDARVTIMNPGDSAKVSWRFTVPQTETYNLFYQIPELNNPSQNLSFTVINGKDTLFNKEYTNAFKSYKWEYLTTEEFDSTSEYLLEINAKGSGTEINRFASDVLKISALVRNREIRTSTERIDLNEIVIYDTTNFNLDILNAGISDLTISSISATYTGVFSADIFPFVIGKFESRTLRIGYFSSELGIKTDTLFIHSDDPVNPTIKLPITAEVEKHFVIIDNDQKANYEETGVWATSVVEAYGNSSRYSLLNKTPLASADFNTMLEYEGLYDIYSIVPVTENATDNALYTLSYIGVAKRAVIQNQNEGSGEWKYLFSSFLPNDEIVHVKVEDTGNSTLGAVLRSDAIKFKLVEETTNINDLSQENLPNNYDLKQNFPNPFNPNTKISYQIKDNGFVSLKVFDVLGREIMDLVQENKKTGFYSIEFNPDLLSSGVYFYRLECNGFVDTKKMILLQ
jgi:hypothetical protein